MSKKADPASKDVATRPENLPVPLSDMMADSSQGFENVSVQDIAIPFLQILQGMSPQVKRGPGQIEGAEEGNIFNSVTGEIFDGNEGIRVIPCAYQKKWVEWVTREEGGGFVRSHDSEDILSQCTRDERNRDVLSNGHLIVTTAYHYVLLVKPDKSYQRAVISMTSTSLKKSRKWNAQMIGLQMTRPDGGKFTPPMFSHSYLLTTVVETKDANSWMNWSIGEPKLVDDPLLYQVAKKFSQDASGNKIKVQETSSPEGDTSHPTDRNVL